MRCEAAQREVSARLDAAGDPALDARLGAHLAACARCTAFEDGARRVRELVRFEPSPPVPDLVPGIMAAVRAEAALRPSDERRARAARRPGSAPRFRRELAAFAAAAAVAAIVAGGLPLIRRGPAPVRAGEIPRLLAEASRSVGAYRATFDVLERGFHPDVPVRRFVATVTFRAPEELRVDVADRTRYPDPAWPRNDVALAVDGVRWSVAGPAVCPREGLPACAPGGVEARAVRGRGPFDGDAPLPTDLVLPLRTLAGSGRLRVVGTGEVLDRPVAVVELDVRDATPLFASLQPVGVWRPFFPLDRVRVSLDRDTLFPLAYRVLPSRLPERREWAMRNGLPREPAGRAVFAAEVRSFGTELPPEWAPGAAGAPSVDAGFRDLPPVRLAEAAGFEPSTPADLRGLRPYRAGLAPGGVAVASYARGLAWLTVRESRSWDGPGLFGDLGPLAAPIALPGGGLAYQEPPTATQGRRLAIHSPGADLVLESSLPLRDLVLAAGSLPVRGEEAPRSWRTRRLPGIVIRDGVPLDRALEAAPFLLLPARLPPEYRLWSVQVVRGPGARVGATLYFRRPGGELDGVGIRLHQSPGTELAPPMDPGALAVRVRGVTGRYSPGRGEIEWVEGRVYRSVRAAGLSLGDLVGVAESLGPPAGEGVGA